MIILFLSIARALVLSDLILRFHKAGGLYSLNGQNVSSRSKDMFFFFLQNQISRTTFPIMQPYDSSSYQIDFVLNGAETETALAMIYKVIFQGMTNWAIIHLISEKKKSCDITLHCPQ